MRMIRWAGVLLVAGLVGACQPKPPPPPPPPVEPVPTPQTRAEIRDSVLQSDPLAKVGEVKGVMPERSMLAVGDVPPKDFAEGDVIQIVGGKRTVLAQGTIQTIDSATGLLVVKYQLNQVVGGRTPEIGDLAVRMTDHPLPIGSQLTAPTAGSGAGAGTFGNPSSSGAPSSGTNSNTVTSPSPTSEPSLPTTQPTTQPTGGNETSPPKPADTDKKPQPAETATQPPANGGNAGGDTATPKPDFNK